MIRIQKPLPKNLYVAVSGGVDSMAVLDFLSRKHIVTALYFNHDTPQSDDFEEVVRNYCSYKNIDLEVAHIENTNVDPNGKSLEEYWRTCRYQFFHAYKDISLDPVVTCHHLDDCVENFLFTSIRHGEGKVIPYVNKNVIRPFRMTEKKVFKQWAERHDVPYLEDKSNKDTSFDRNYIRHELMPHVERINPGIKKVVRKIIEKEK